MFRYQCGYNIVNGWTTTTSLKSNSKDIKNGHKDNHFKFIIARLVHEQSG